MEQMRERGRSDGRTPLDLYSALKKSKGVSVIAEVKKASPSKGLIRPRFHPGEIARDYALGGADAISVLTEREFFLGNEDDLEEVRSQTPQIPILRKDFILEPYQVYEARAMGADAVLLIAAALPQKDLAELYDLAGELGLQCLVEIHNEEEARRAMAIHPAIVGINNRDLSTFAVSLDTTRKLRTLFSGSTCVVSESGIQGREHMREMADMGVDAVLIGETLMRSEQAAEALRELKRYDED